jgi:hypothetical protein
VANDTSLLHGVSDCVGIVTGRIDVGSSSSGIIFGFGIGIVILGFLNFFVTKLHPVAHTTMIVAGLGAVVALFGVALFVAGSRKSA